MIDVELWFKLNWIQNMSSLRKLIRNQAVVSGRKNLTNGSSHYVASSATKLVICNMVALEISLLAFPLRKFCRRIWRIVALHRLHPKKATLHPNPNPHNYTWILNYCPKVKSIRHCNSLRVLLLLVFRKILFKFLKRSFRKDFGRDFVFPSLSTFFPLYGPEKGSPLSFYHILK